MLSAGSPRSAASRIAKGEDLVGADQVRNRLRRGNGAGPPAFDKQLYERRNVVEGCFNRLKQWRGIATRYDTTAKSYRAAVTLASPLMCA